MLLDKAGETLNWASVKGGHFGADAMKSWDDSEGERLADREEMIERVIYGTP